MLFRSKWLSQYDSLDGVIAHADEIGGVVGQNLRKALDWLPLARQLVTVKCDCDLSDHRESILASLQQRAEDKTALKAFFEKMGFRTWLRELNASLATATASDAATEGAAITPSAAQPDEAPTQKHYETIFSDTQLDQWLARINAAALTAIDTETTSLDALRAELVGISLCCEPGIAAYIPLAHRYPGAPSQLSREHVLAKLKPWLEDASKPKLGQHLKYDCHVLQNYGIHEIGRAHV